MQTLPKAVRQLVESFERLPGIGPKSAQRLVFYLLHTPEAYLDDFAQRMTALKRDTVLCGRCHHISEVDPCPVCSDQTRDQALLCVVEQPLDLIAIESSGTFHGLYHVLHGSIAPLSNIGPDQLFLYDLKSRLGNVTEMILATNPTMEGEATALFIREYVQSLPSDLSASLKITRIGHGIPIGADIEYADSVTLKRALEGRRAV